MRPRLRPSWRVAIKISVLLSLLVFPTWAARVLGTALADRDIALADRDMKEIRILADRRVAEMQAEIEMERDKARRAAQSKTYALDDDPELCELLHGKPVAVCDSAALKAPR